MHSLNIRNVSEEFMQDLRTQATQHKMHLREYCIMILEEGIKARSGGYRIEPFRYEALSDSNGLGQELEKMHSEAKEIQAATESYAGPVPAVPEQPDVVVHLNPDWQVRRIPAVPQEAFDTLDKLKADAERLTGADSMKPVNQIQKLCPKCKREKMKVRDETTLRCSLCGYQEARC